MTPAFSSKAFRLLLALLLLGALLPSALRLGSLLSDGQWVELCTAQGMRMVNLQTGEEQVSQGQPCALCQLQTLGAGPPPAPPVWALPERLAERPAAFLQAPQPLAIWRHALSRGPPSQISA